MIFPEVDRYVSKGLSWFGDLKQGEDGHVVRALW